MDTILSFLRDPAWSGISGLVAILAFGVYLFIERDRLFTNMQPPRSSAVSGCLLGSVLGTITLILALVATALFGPVARDIATLIAQMIYYGMALRFWILGNRKLNWFRDTAMAVWIVVTIIMVGPLIDILSMR